MNEKSAYIRLFDFTVYVYRRQPLVSKFRLAVEVNGGDGLHIGCKQGVNEVQYKYRPLLTLPPLSSAKGDLTFDHLEYL
jgi:hypothetical protein